MTYAVIRTGGKQYRVAQGDLVQVEKLAGEIGEKIDLSEVLLIAGNGETKIGTPTVAEAKVTAEIVEQRKARKVLVFKKKRRKSYSRMRGHRQLLTTLRIIDIQE